MNKLQIMYKGYENNWLRYFFSGGLNFRQLAPDFMDLPLRKIESLLMIFARHLSIHQIVVIKKI